MEFRTAEHLACLREVRTAVRTRSAQWAEEALATTIAGDPVQGARQLQRDTKTGEWMTVQPSMANRKDMGAQKWQYAPFLRYVL